MAMPICGAKTGEAVRTTGRQRRPPPQLRTKTGCLTCRQRRKKCDERKPRCVSCTRNAIDCRWGEKPSIRHSNTSTTSDSTSSPPSCFLMANSPDFIHLYSETGKQPDGVVSSPQHSVSHDRLSDSPTLERSTVLCQSDGNPFHLSDQLSPFTRPSEDEHYLMLVYFQREVIPATTHMHAHPGYFDYSYQFSWISKYPQLSTAISASAAMHLSMTQPSYRNLALNYYSSAIRALRQMILEDVVDGTEDFVLGTVILFDLLERWRLDGLPNAGEQHLVTALQLFKVRRCRGPIAQTSAQVAFERLCAESILYHSAHILLSSDHSILKSHLSLIRELKDTCEAVPFADSNVWSASPTLGLPFAVIELILQIAVVCRPSSPVLVEVFGSFWQQLNDLDVAHRSLPPTKNRDDEIRAQSYTSTTRLYLIAAKVLLLDSVLQEHVSAPEIRTLVQDGLHILGMVDTSIPFGRFYCWPCSVLRSVAEREADVIFLDEKLASIENASQCGYTRRLMRECKNSRSR
ncbi:hypothetical protein BKA65DRAFT_533358 [Rhexocercosporidium sp. MPI-PUGE-AT-0058]|nr:hypothetical protein BKA65DRAFT_533358 [Rhexocercosporidium sp. MPI-PUGE-AT-0058]